MYCPHCDMDFVEGVTVCSDCGAELVDKETYLAEQAEIAAAEEAQAAKEAEEKLEAINNLTEEDLEQIRERQEAYSEMMREPSVYVNDKDKYSDNQSSGVALVIVGVIIGIGAVLMWAGILPDLGIIMKIALTGFAVLCAAGAVISFKKAKEFKNDIALEEDKEKELIDSFLEKYDREAVANAVTPRDLTEEELALERMNYIQDKLSVENDITDKAFAAMLAEEIYTRLFEE